VDHSFLQLYRSDATALRTHAWRRNRSFRQCSIRLIEKASVTNFIGKSIPRPDRFLSRDKFFYECKGCGALLKPKAGDCCVFCSYGDVPCPPIQEARQHGRATGCCAGT
jgi:hypothetical protein